MTGVPPAQQQRGRPAETYPRFTLEDHPTIRFSRTTFIELRARGAGEYRTSEAPLDDDEEAFDITRRRVGVSGEIAGILGFEVERELVSFDPWRDVYAEYRQFPVLRVRGGKFKLPFGLEENTSVDNLDFAYRSMASNQLAPGRDRGVMAYGRLLNRRVNYEAGWFAGDGTNAQPRQGRDDQVQGGTSMVGRIVIQPARNSNTPAEGLEFGAAYMTSEVEEGLSAIRGQTMFGPTFFPSDFWVNGTRTRIGLQGRWSYKQTSIKSEYIRLQDERLGMSVDDTDLPKLRATGWYVSGSFVLTGEDESNAENPRRPLFQGGFGSIEIAARTEKLLLDSAAGGPSDGEGGIIEPSSSPRAAVLAPNGVRAHTVGVNWHPNRWLKVQFNLVREILDDPERGPLPSQAGFWNRVLRVQFSI